VALTIGTGLGILLCVKTYPWLIFPVLGALAGCGGGLRVTNVGSDTVKPANVQVLFVVEDEEKQEAIVGLGPESFQVYEDNALVSSAESFKIVNPDLTSSQSTLLLLDWSGNVAGTPEATAMIDAATAFVNRIRPQKIAVFAFDGSPDLHPVVAFGATEQQAKAGFDALKDWKPRDDTSNLNGATLAALKALRATTGDLIAGGALVIVSRQPDRAGRVSERDLDAALQKPENDRIRRFSISLSPAAPKGTPEEKSKGTSGGGDGFGSGFRSRGAGATAAPASSSSATTADIGTKLDELAARIGGFGKGYYMLALCSGARAGRHEVRIEVTRKLTNEKGHETTQSGTLTHKFSAEGFGPGCKPTIPPELGGQVERAEMKSEPKPESKPASKPESKPAAKPTPKPAAPAATIPSPATTANPEVFQP
jgi:hypothetical protein